MRKNLLLALMVLLPFVAWAQDDPEPTPGLTEVLIVAANTNKVYGQTDAEAVKEYAIQTEGYTHAQIDPFLTLIRVNNASMGEDANTNYSYTYQVDDAAAAAEGLKIRVTSSSYLFIKPKDISNLANFEFAPATFTYDGTEKKPTVSNVTLGEDWDKEITYEVTYNNNVNVSDAAEVIVNGTGNYTGSVTKYFSITPADLTAGAIAFTPAELTYNKQDQKPEITVTLGETELGEGDFNVAYYDNEDCEGDQLAETVNAATYYVKVSGMGNFEGDLIGSYVIKPRDINDENVLINSSAFTPKRYTGKQITLNAGDRLYYPETGAENRLVKGTDFTCEWGENIEVGEKAGSITFTGKGNYTGTRTEKFDIVPAEVTENGFPGLEIADFLAKPYTGSKIEPAIHEAVEATETTEAVAAEGVVTFTPEDATAALTLVEGEDYEVAYGDDEHDNINVASGGAVVYTFKKNFKGSFTKEFGIAKAALTVTADDVAIAYGANRPDPLTYSAETFLGEDDITLLDGKVVVNIYNNDGPAEGGLEAGTYFLRPEFVEEGEELDNYTVEFVDGTLTVGKATLTVTVDDAEKFYGDDDPAFSYTVTGFANGDTEAIFGNSVAAFTREEGENVGEYAVNATGLEATSYNIQYVPGKLTINKAPITLTATDQTVAFGEAPELGVGYNHKAKGNETKPTITFSGAELKNGDSRAKLNLTLTLMRDDEEIEPTDLVIGENEGVLVVGADNPNYEFTFVNGNVTVNANEGGLILYTDNKADYIEELDKNEATIKAYDGIEVNQVQITSTNYSMKAEQWYTLVLPFATTVRTISQAFGYAVVDVLNVANTTVNEYYFDNVMGTIPANTPFILKIDQPIQNGINIWINAPYGPVEVEGDEPTVVWQEIPFTIEYADAPQVTDAAGNVFCGTYGKMNLNNGENVFSIGDGKIHATNAGAYLRPLAAYLAPANAEAPVRVFIEEIDGTVTAINSVDAEANGAAAEGWYTISGVKLNAQPTEKGIYIFNGKKVAIQ